MMTISRGIITTIALGLGPLVLTLAAPGSAEASDPEVRILGSLPTTPLAHEIREELAARGILSTPDGQVGSNPHAIVWVYEDHVEIRVLDPSKASSLPTHHEIAVKHGTEADRLVAAREAAEWLRTRLFPPALAMGGASEVAETNALPEGAAPSMSADRAKPVKAIQPPQTAPTSRGGVPIAVTLGAAVVGSRGGVPAVWGAHGSIAYQATDRWGVGAWGFLPMTKPSVDRKEGSATARTTLVGAGPYLSFPLGRLGVEVSLGGAAVVLRTDGRPSPAPSPGPAEGSGRTVIATTDSVVLGMPYLRASASVRIARPIGLRCDLLGGAPIPEAGVFFVGSEVARLAVPIVMATTSLEIDFGSP